MSTPSDNLPSLSVVVCTRNGKARIEETLISLRHQSLDGSHYDVLVVDNASDDGTAEWLAARQESLRFTLVHESELGLCAARNRGIAESKGDIVVFIDDDAIAPAHFLARLIDGFSDQSVDACGGPVHGRWEATPPRWLVARYWRGLSLVSYGDQERLLRFPEILLGTNMAFRRSVFSRIGPFNTAIGRKGSSLAGGEVGDDRELQKRLAAAGGKVLYRPDCFVFHLVPPARMTFEYFRKRTYDEAYSQAMHRLQTGAAETMTPKARLGALDRRLLGGAITRLGLREPLAKARVGWIAEAESDARRDFAAGKKS